MAAGARMPGVRVYQLAKELRVQSALIVELLDRLGKEVHSDLSSIDDLTASLVRERLTVALAVEKKRLLEEQRTDDEPVEVAASTDASAEAPPAVAEVDAHAGGKILQRQGAGPRFKSSLSHCVGSLRTPEPSRAPRLQVADELLKFFRYRWIFKLRKNLPVKVR
jgi:hypothetical protein